MESPLNRKGASCAYAYLTSSTHHDNLIIGISYRPILLLVTCTGVEVISNIRAPTSSKAESRAIRMTRFGGSCGHLRPAITEDSQFRFLKSAIHNSNKLIVQVSVRRAGMQAAARLLKEVPSEREVARLWVRAVLPMVSAAPFQSLP